MRAGSTLDPPAPDPLRAFVAACLLIAQADGEVTPDERGRMVETLGARRPPLGEAPDLTDVIEAALTAFETLEAGFEQRPEEALAEAELMIRALKGRPEAESVADAVTVLAVDGGLTAEERRLVLGVCDWLGVGPAPILLWPRSRA